MKCMSIMSPRHDSFYMRTSSMITSDLFAISAEYLCGMCCVTTTDKPSMYWVSILLTMTTRFLWTALKSSGLGRNSSAWILISGETWPVHERLLGGMRLRPTKMLYMCTSAVTLGCLIVHLAHHALCQRYHPRTWREYLVVSTAKVDWYVACLSSQEVWALLRNWYRHQHECTPTMSYIIWIKAH